MSAKTNKLTIQEGKKDYGKEATEETKETLQGDDEFDGGDEEFEAARAEEIAFDRARAEERVARASSERAENLAGYAMGPPNKPEEEEE